MPALPLRLRLVFVLTLVTALLTGSSIALAAHNTSKKPRRTCTTRVVEGHKRTTCKAVSKPSAPLVMTKRHRVTPTPIPAPTPTTTTTTPAPTPAPTPTTTTTTPAPTPAPAPAPTPAPTPTSPASLSGGLVVGMADGAAGWGGASTAPYLSQLTSETGSHWFREEFLWSSIEPTQGTYDWSYYDHYMTVAAQAGVHVLAVPDSSPSWAAPAGNALPTDPTTYAAFVAALAGRYGPGGSFWAQNPTLTATPVVDYELWNEPYFSSGNGGNYNPAAYANLVKDASIALKAVAPSVKILMEAEMQSALTNGQWVWWVDALYQAVPDLNNYFDGVSMHDYGNDMTGYSPIVAGQAYANYGRTLRIYDLRQQFINHAAVDKPFWLTEIGWSTCTGGNTDCVTQAQQAANMTTLFSYLHGSWASFVQAAFVYRCQDGSNAANIGDAYGLVQNDGTPKPALAILKQYTTTSA